MTFQRFGRSVAFVVALAGGTASPALADDHDVLAVEMAGTLRAGLWSANRRLEDKGPVGTGQLWLNGSAKGESGFIARLDGRLAVEDGGDDAPGELRNATVGFQSDAVDITIGRQLVVWGRTDRVNPTDVVTPRAYTLLTPEDAEQRLGILAARADIPLGNATMTIAWLPEFRSSKIPIGPLPAGLHIDRSHGSLDASQWAVRLDESGGTVDYALYWFHGIDRLPTYSARPTSLSSVDIVEANGRIDMIGADAALPIGSWNARGEVALLLQDWPKPAASISLVAGGDRDLGNSLNLNVQVLASIVVDGVDPDPAWSDLDREVARRSALINNQVTSTQYGASFRLSKDWLNASLLTEIAVVEYFSDRSGLLRPKIIWLASDTVSFTFGADYYWGEYDSFFGQLEMNNLLYAQIALSF